MVLNKRGMVITLVTITLLSLFALSYGTYNLIQDRSSTNKRITTLNNYVASVEQDLPRQIFISGYRSVFLLNKKILETGSYIDDVNLSINEMFFNGTLDGVSQDIMDEATFSDIQDKLEGVKRKLEPRTSQGKKQIKKKIKRQIGIHRH